MTRLDFTLRRAFGSWRFYAENQPASAILDAVERRCLSFTEVSKIAPHFDVWIREGKLEAVGYLEFARTVPDEIKLGGF